MKIKPIPRVAKRPRRSPKRLKGQALFNLRFACSLRALLACQECGNPTTWEAGHMHHIKHRSLGGKDELSNVQWLCASCHTAHHNPKACPKKVK